LLKRQIYFELSIEQNQVVNATVNLGKGIRS